MRSHFNIIGVILRCRDPSFICFLQPVHRLLLVILFSAVSCGTELQKIIRYVHDAPEHDEEDEEILDLEFSTDCFTVCFFFLFDTKPFLHDDA